MNQPENQPKSQHKNLFVFGPGYSARHYLQENNSAFAQIGASSRTRDMDAALAALGVEPVLFNDRQSVITALTQSQRVLVSIPPVAAGEGGDVVLDTYADALAQLPAGARVIYLSTVGVYGDHGGAWVDETSACVPVSMRSKARLAAEDQWRDVAGRHTINLHILRLSGIYGPGRSALDTLRAGTARRIIKAGQVFNRIHVDDIARAIAACFSDTAADAITHGVHVWNVTDDEPAPPQDVVAYAAQLLGVTPPPEVAFEDAPMTPMARSFYGENKRVSNRAMKDGLGVVLRYPNYREGLAGLM